MSSNSRFSKEMGHRFRKYFGPNTDFYSSMMLRISRPQSVILRNAMTKNLLSYSAEILPPFSRQNDIHVAIAVY